MYRSSICLHTLADTASSQSLLPSASVLFAYFLFSQCTSSIINNNNTTALQVEVTTLYHIMNIICVAVLFFFMHNHFYILYSIVHQLHARTFMSNAEEVRKINVFFYFLHLNSLVVPRRTLLISHIMCG